MHIKPDMVERRVNKKDSLPAYIQLKDFLRKNILNGQYKVGDRIPSETALSEYHKISRMTVRQATQELFQEGLLYKIRGKGTFVSKPKPIRDLSQLTSQTGELKKSGYNTSTQVLELKIIQLAKEAAHHLELDKGTKATIIKRLRLIDNKPFSWEMAFVPVKLCPSLIHEDLAMNSLFRLMEQKYGLILSDAVMSIEAIGATEGQGKLLKTPTGYPLLRIKQTVYLLDGRPVEFAEVLSRSDLFTYQLERKKKYPPERKRSVP
jgi:GntR family transcriptional regulator